MALENYLIHLGILSCIYTILIISLNLTIGYTGILNLGHVAFYGIGAYSSALLSLNGFPLWLSILFAGFISLIFGFIISLPTNRLKGDYLAVTFLGFAFIMDSITKNWTEFTGGTFGIRGIKKLFQDDFYYLIFTLLFVLITLMIFYFITRSRTGKIFQAIRDDELAAKILGKNTFFYKILSMSISAFFAGLAGSLYAHYLTFIDPKTFFTITEIVLLLTMLIIGGLASLKGSVVGVMIIFIITESVKLLHITPSILGPLREIIFSIALLLILILKPKGIFGRVDIK